MTHVTSACDRTGSFGSRRYGAVRGGNTETTKKPPLGNQNVFGRAPAVIRNLCGYECEIAITLIDVRGTMSVIALSPN